MPSSDRPRVVVVADASPAKGGIATYAEALVGDPYLDATHDVSLLNTTRVAEWRGGSFTIGNVRRAIEDAVHVARAAKNADVVHIQTALLPTLPLLRALVLCLAARIGGAATVCHVHTGQTNVGPYEDFHPRGLEGVLLRGLRAADAVAVVSEAGARGLRRAVPQLDIVVLPNAVELETIERRDTGGPPTVLYVGAIGEAKGLLDLLDAARILHERGLTAWDLAVVGGSNQQGRAEADHVREAFRSAGVDAALVGETSLHGVRRHLASADIFVLPSHSEGQPLAILEAMAAGLPVVATEVGGIPDMVRDGEEGLLVPPRDPVSLADALEALLTDPERRRRLGERAAARVRRRFDRQGHVRRLVELYEAASMRRSSRRSTIGAHR